MSGKVLTKEDLDGRPILYHKNEKNNRILGVEKIIGKVIMAQNEAENIRIRVEKTR